MRSNVRTVPGYLATNTFRDIEQVRRAVDWRAAMGNSHWQNLRHSKGVYVILMRALDPEQRTALRQQILDRFNGCKVIYQSAIDRCYRTRNQKLVFSSTP